MIFNFNPVNVEIVKASRISREKNSKGEDVTWFRLDDSVKSDPANIITSKDFKEYATTRPVVDIAGMGQFLVSHAGNVNVQEWVASIFDAVNRRIIQSAAAEGKASAGLIGDIESLIHFETAETARGRKASKLNGEQWKLVLPVLLQAGQAYYVNERGYDGEKAKNVTVRLMQHARVILCTSAPFSNLGILNALESVVIHAMETAINSKPELESLIALCVQFVDATKQLAMADNLDEY